QRRRGGRPFRGCGCGAHRLRSIERRRDRRARSGQLHRARGRVAALVSGVSMNPARSFGPALVSGDFAHYWVYVVGPLAGAAIAVAFAFILRGAGGTAISRAAGSGVLEPGLFQRRARLAAGLESGEVTPPGIAEREKRSD